MDSEKYRSLIVAPLSQSLDEVATSYKFLFFKAILDSLNITGRQLSRKNPIPLWEIYALAVYNAWYPVEHFRLTLGTIDQIPK